MVNFNVCHRRGVWHYSVCSRSKSTRLRLPYFFSGLNNILARGIQSLVFPRKPVRINQFSFQKHRFMSRMVISYQLGYFAVGLALQRVILAEMNPAVDRPDSIDPALPVLAQEFAAISPSFIEPEFPVLCQKAIDQFDLRIGDAWFAPNDGRTATLSIALVRPSAFHSVLDFNVCQSTPEVCQGHSCLSREPTLPNIYIVRSI